MCKIFAMPGIKEKNVKKAQAFVEQVGPLLASPPDNDGFGYAAITKDGKVFGERWLNPKEIYKQPTKNKALSSAQEKIFDGFGNSLKYNVPTVSGAHMEFGTKNMKDVVTIIAHARNKTAGVVSIENTHPFFMVDDPKGAPDIALIHNGTIRNHYNLETKKTSTCDSEVIMLEWDKLNMESNIELIDKLAKKLIGEYACAILSSQSAEDGEVYPQLDVFKSNKPLYVAHIEELETKVFCTKEDVIERACKASGYKRPNIHEFLDGNYLRFDATTGEVVDATQFELSDRTIPYEYRGGNLYGPSNTPNYENRQNTDKKNFTDKHPHLFDSYITVEELSKEDIAFLKDKGADKTNKDHRAFYLIFRSLAS